LITITLECVLLSKIILEPRRRNREGRRGHSPRRTQSSSNRMEMYFSEVDMEMRKVMSREPVENLT
jgi:receptor expression-enhancing protein 1/2/3/4